MTRERLIEIMNCHSDADTERLADAILAEMAGEWNAGLEAAAKLFEPSCSCPEPCDDYWIWPSPCATKAAAQIRALRRPDAAPAPAAAARPVPHAGEVAEIVRHLETEWRYCSGGVVYIDRSILKRAADLLTAQAAEIERLKARCENLRSAMNSDPDVIALRTRQEELEAALRLALDSLEYIQQSHPECTGIAARVEAIKVSHTALAPAGKEVKP